MVKVRTVSLDLGSKRALAYHRINHFFLALQSKLNFDQ